MSDLFMRATREAFRFPSVRGELTTEQLWGLHLQSKTGADLDSVAKAVNSELKACAEESFVQASNPKADVLAAKLDVVKAIIAVKIAENAAAKSASEKAALKARLTDILEKKQYETLLNKSEDELRAEIAALG